MRNCNQPIKYRKVPEYKDHRTNQCGLFKSALYGEVKFEERVNIENGHEAWFRWWKLLRLKSRNFWHLEKISVKKY